MISHRHSPPARCDERRYALHGDLRMCMDQLEARPALRTDDPDCCPAQSRRFAVCSCFRRLFKKVCSIQINHHQHTHHAQRVAYITMPERGVDLMATTPMPYTPTAGATASRPPIGIAKRAEPGDFHQRQPVKSRSVSSDVPAALSTALPAAFRGGQSAARSGRLSKMMVMATKSDVAVFDQQILHGLAFLVFLLSDGLL